MTETNPPPIVLLDDNLFTSSRVASALRSRGRQVLVARAVGAVEACDIALINLGSRSLGAVALIEPLRAKFPGAKIFGFCGHLEIEIRRAAKEAGVDRLLTNESVAALEWLDD
jgi:DNA-binding NarL/FixJ family response regulator